MEPARWPQLVTGVASLVLLSAPIAALSQVGAGWSPKGSMPYERAEMAIAAVNGKIYLISGGCAASRPTPLTKNTTRARGLGEN
jgi:hypothetical protein